MRWPWPAPAGSQIARHHQRRAGDPRASRRPPPRPRKGLPTGSRRRRRARRSRRGSRYIPAHPPDHLREVALLPQDALTVSVTAPQSGWPRLAAATRRADQHGALEGLGDLPGRPCAFASACRSPSGSCRARRRSPRRSRAPPPRRCRCRRSRARRRARPRGAHGRSARDKGSCRRGRGFQGFLEEGRLAGRVVAHLDGVSGVVAADADQARPYREAPTGCRRPAAQPGPAVRSREIGSAASLRPNGTNPGCYPSRQVAGMPAAPVSLRPAGTDLGSAGVDRAGSGEHDPRPEQLRALKMLRRSAGHILTGVANALHSGSPRGAAGRLRRSGAGVSGTPFLPARPAFSRRRGGRGQPAARRWRCARRRRAASIQHPADSSTSTAAPAGPGATIWCSSWRAAPGPA